MNYKEYHKHVMEDLVELQQEYPFMHYTQLPTAKPTPITINVLAANKNLIHLLHAKEEDFLGNYSRALIVEVPFDYREVGCHVFGGAWIDDTLILGKDKHYYDSNKKSDGSRLLCVGVPESFVNLKNVILENVRTAENILAAYEQYQCGDSSKVNLIAYSHGDPGRNTYVRNTKKYKSK